MKGAVFHGLGHGLTIETLPDPKPGPAELVLRVKACGICGSGQVSLGRNSDMR